LLIKIEGKITVISEMSIPPNGSHRETCEKSQWWTHHFPNQRARDASVALKISERGMKKKKQSTEI
jgi:hypothetical protein